jgi:ABC-type antimicrobial peptide transport system permease subunit
MDAGLAIHSSQRRRTPGFAAVAMLVMMLGIGSAITLSYITAQRTTEIGVRIALGAQRAQLLGMILVDGIFQCFKP